MPEVEILRAFHSLDRFELLQVRRADRIALGESDRNGGGRREPRVISCEQRLEGVDVAVASRAQLKTKREREAGARPLVSI